MLFLVEERLKGVKYNIDFGWRRGGGDTKGEWIDMSTMKKGAVLQKCVNTFVVHCSFTTPFIKHKKRKKEKTENIPCVMAL